MKNLYTNSILIYVLSCGWVLLSFILALSWNDREFFGASGAAMVLAGAILPARALFRLGPEAYFKAQRTFDGGTYGAEHTEEELAAEREERQDDHAYRVSFPILILGTLIWAYGAWIMKFFGLAT